MNCHQNTEAADLLGGLRPLRGRNLLVQELRQRGRDFIKRCAEALGGKSYFAAPDAALPNTPSDLDNADVAGVITAVQVNQLFHLSVFMVTLGKSVSSRVPRASDLRVHISRMQAKKPT